LSSFTQFDAKLRIQYDDNASRVLGADHWRVTEGFRFYIGDDKSGEWVNVPDGYLTDGASVPRIFWSIIPPWGAYGQAAVVHDILCEYLSITKDGLPMRITRARCDEILLEAMIALGVPAWKRQVIYRAVCLFRVFSGVEEPTTTLLKRRLEAEWA
jgi:hypothetical protein